MHQCRGLQRLPGLLLGQLRSGQLPQFFVDQRQKLFGGRGITCLNLAEDTCDVAHDRCSLERNRPCAV